MSNTKYIFAGGYPHKAEENGKSFFSTLIKENAKKTNILICLFSRTKETWNAGFLQDKNFYEKVFTEYKLNIKCASEENFIQELDWADSVYFRGGNTELLFERLSKYPDWKLHIHNKIVAGSSAGAYMLSKYYYDIETMDIKPGLGLTDSKVIVHWKSEEYKVNWDEALKELNSFKKHLELPTIFLKEGEYIGVSS